MSLEVAIARWVAVFWVVFGLSHVLHARLWTQMLMPLRKKPDGGFWLALISFPLALFIVVGHNVWVWDIPVIVTVAGWATTIKCTMYVFFPRSHTAVMSVGGQVKHPERGFRIVGTVMVVLGLVVGYDAFFRR